MLRAKKICGISGLDSIKRAALLFDEVILCAPQVSRNKLPSIPDIIPSEFCPMVINTDNPEFGIMLDVCISMQEEDGIECVPVYGALDSVDNSLLPGNHHLYQASIEAIPIVIEEKVEWGQILEMRSDTEALWKYQAFRSWLTSGLKAKSTAEAVDIIGAKIAQYEWAIKKHGLKTATGSLTTLLNSKSIAAITAGASATGVFAGPIWAAVSAGLLISGKAAVYVVDRLIDLEDIKRSENSEIARFQVITAIALRSKQVHPPPH